MPTDRVTYPPLDVLKPVVGDVWIVDSGPLRAFGVPLPLRMTLIRLSGGDLWLHSPTRLTEDLAQALNGLGRVRHLVAPNLAHWTFAADWQSRYPDAMTWAAPGLRERAQVRRRGIRLDRDLAQSAPDEWAGEIEQVIVPGAGGFTEVDFFHVGSRTLVLTDLIVNLEAEKLPMLLRPAARLAGIVAPDGKAPIYLRLIIRAKREKATEAAHRLLDWAPDRVVFSHGRWFERDGTAALRRSLRWLVG